MSVTRPANLSLPFANSGTKNTIPVASQIGITNGAASYTDGFPPLTMTPIAAGGTPPFGQDMNGALFAISAHTVFANAGGQYQFDSALATAVGGYAVGAVLQSNDGLSAYYNILAGNTTDFNSTPASIGVSWIPFAGKCITTNVIQTGSSIIAAITGTANALIATCNPAITAYNNGMTIRFKVTSANTAAVTINAGAGAVSLLNRSGGALISGDLTAGAIYSATYDNASSSFFINQLVNSQYLTQASAQITAVAGGTADALTATFSPAITTVSNQTILVRAASANATTTPTINPGSGVITIVKGNNLPLVAGDIAGAGHWLELTLDATFGKAVLQNPALGVSVVPISPSTIQYFATNTAPTGWLKANGAAVSRVTYAALFAAIVTAGGFSSQNFTVTIASPGVFTKTAHGFIGGERLRLSTTGALPTGLNTSTDYFVEPIDANTYYLSLVPFGTRIVTTGTQSGTHSFLQSWFGIGDGSTTFNLPDLRGEFPRGYDDGRGVDTNHSFGAFQKGTLSIGDMGASVATFSPRDATAATSAVALAGAGYDTVNTIDYPLDNGSATGSGSASSLATLQSGGEAFVGQTRPRNVSLLACIKY